MPRKVVVLSGYDDSRLRLNAMIFGFVLVVTLCLWSSAAAKCGIVSDEEIKELSKVLLANDVNNAARFITLATQGHANAGSQTDQAPNPLLTVDPEALALPTISKLQLLWDNYDRNTQKAEVVTPNEQIEEKEFLKAVLGTAVMNKTKAWLEDKGLIAIHEDALKNLLEEVWFTLYSRGHHRKSSSAFEHTFLGEIKNNEVSGMHNWIYFHNEEANKRLNYLGWLRKVELVGKKGWFLKVHYNWSNYNKPVGTLFSGTSPELELALYTVCILARPNQKCYLSVAKQDIFIQSYTFKGPKNKNLIGSVYPGL